MNAFKPLIPLALFAVITFASCGKEAATVTCGSASWWNEVADEWEGVANAASAWATDPSVSNCEKYKDSYKDYIDALRNLDKCVTGSERKEFNDELDEAEESLEQLEC